MPVEIKFKARAVNDDVGLATPCRLSGERILLAQTLRLPKRHRFRNFGPEVMAIVNRGRHDRPGSVLNRPQTLIGITHGANSASQPVRLPCLKTLRRLCSSEQALG
jgi:hypothetical protein